MNELEVKFEARIAKDEKIEPNDYMPPEKVLKK